MSLESGRIKRIPSFQKQVKPQLMTVSSWYVTVWADMTKAKWPVPPSVREWHRLLRICCLLARP